MPQVYAFFKPKLVIDIENFSLPDNLDKKIKEHSVKVDISKFQKSQTFPHKITKK